MKSREYKEFLELKPIDGPCDYDDFKKAFYSAARHSATSGGNHLPATTPAVFHLIECSQVDVDYFDELVRAHSRTAVKLVTYTQCKYINGERKPTLVLTLENPMLVDSRGDDDGEGNQIVTVSVEYTKAKKKTTAYNSDGSVFKSSNSTWDFEKGKFTR